MRSDILAILLSAGLLLPWILALGGDESSIGMYADSRHVLFQGDSDVYDCIWHFTWIRDSVERGSDPRTYAGRTLAWNNMAWPDLYLSLVFRHGYQISLLLSSLLTAFAGYFLARSWGISRNGSLLAAFIMVWMPVRLIRMYQHYPVAAMGYTLFALGMIKKWLDSGHKSYPVAALVFSALAVSESFQHGLTIALGWLITLLLSNWKGYKNTAISGLLPGLGCILGAAWLLTAPGSTGMDPGKDWKESVYWGAEVQSYFLPSFLGEPLITGYMPNPFEGVVTPGLTVIVLGTLYCIRKKNWKAAAAAGLIMIFSVGPLFKIGGVPTPIPLPYMVIAKTPWLSAARAPARLGVIVGIMAAMAAGAMIASRRTGLGWVLTGLVILELTPLGLKKIDTAVPDFYETGTALEPVLEIPASSAIRRYSLFEAADGLGRRVKFFARGGEDMEEGIPPGLMWQSEVLPSRADLASTGAATVVYNRWIFPEQERAFYDSLYEGIFLPEEMEDSVWVWSSE